MVFFFFHIEVVLFSSVPISVVGEKEQVLPSECIERVV